MSRIHMVDPTQSTSEQKALLDTIQSQLGMVPNFLKVLANSPAALKAFLGLHSVAHSGTLSLQTRERIALALAQHNACAYCVAAHTAIAHKAGLSQDDIAAARSGRSEDAKADVAVRLAKSLVEHKGDITTAELMEARDERRLLRVQKQMAAVKLLIIDELGFVPLSKTGAELLFEMISQRYERGATLITSNLPFDEWTETFGTERLTGALLDRLTHHVNILEMNGESYRLAQSRARKPGDNN